jgi:sulfite exporter TauE/SafE
LLGGLLGVLGGIISLDNPIIFALLTIIASVVMFIMALQMIGVGWAQFFKVTAPKSVTHYVADESNFQRKYMPFGLGVLTFILPCGFTLVAQTAALASGSLTQGALIMLAFSLGTLPSLMAISYSGIAFNSKPDITAKFNLVAGILIIFFSFYNINSQLNLLNLPSFSDVNISQLATSPSTASSSEDVELVDTNSEGIQQLNVVASGFSYNVVGPTGFRAGEPAVISVLNQGASGCAVAIAATGLFANYVILEPGENVIEVPNPQPGSYKLTCSMGMVDPVIINVI